MEIVTLVFNTLLEYGAIGILAFAGWGLSGYFLFRDYKKKEGVNLDIKAKDRIIELKDIEISKAREKLTDAIKEISDKRLEDLKEIVGDYNEVASNITYILEKVSDALDIKEAGEKDGTGHR